MTGRAWAILIVGAVLLLLLESVIWIWNRGQERKRARRMVTTVLGRAVEVGLVDKPLQHALDAAFMAYEQTHGLGEPEVLAELKRGCKFVVRERAFLRGNRLQSAVVLAALLGAGFQVHGDEPPATDQVSAGGGYGGAKKGGGAPVVIIGVDFPVNLGQTPDATARVYSETTLEGMEGETVELGDARTFRAIRGDLWIQRRIGTDGDGGATYVALRGGGAVRLDTAGDEPLIRAPIWYSGDMVFERRQGDHFPHRRLSIGFGHSDLSSPPQRVPGTLRDAARDAVPRDIMVGGNVTVTSSARVGDDTYMKVVIGGYVHRAVYGKTGTFAAFVSATMTFGKAS